MTVVGVSDAAGAVSRRRYERERQARMQAETLLDEKSRELWEVNQRLLNQAGELEIKVKARTAELDAARKRAEDANRAKSVFLASMSHEIRTPLNGVLGMAQVLSDSPLEAEQLRMAETIVESGEMLLTVLNDILDISKIEAGQLDIECVAFDLVDAMDATKQLFRQKAEEKGLALAFAIEEPARRWIRSDPTRLRQVTGNLLSNAIKFTMSGTVKVTISLNPDEPETGLLSIAVSDTGIGIPPDKLPRLFQPFSQVDSTISRRFGGTGLGLSISRQICRMMEGDITVDSVEGAGTTFLATTRVRLAETADRSRQRRNLDAAATALHTNPLSVLLAEDNRTNQLVFSKFLKDFPITITKVENGAEAVEAAARKTFDMIFMDINMPEMDGVTATTKIRRAQAERGQDRTPIIALTANAMVDQIAGYLAAGMDGHLPKPLKKERLIMDIAETLQL